MTGIPGWFSWCSSCIFFLGMPPFPDHVHLLFELGRTVPVSMAVNQLKRGSTLWIRCHGIGLDTFRWQAGYGIFSVGRNEVEAVARYVRNQHQHHRGHSFKDELRAFCRDYQLEWDERYVWD
jgi:hypothetical protein